MHSCSQKNERHSAILLKLSNLCYDAITMVRASDLLSHWSIYFFFSSLAGKLSLPYKLDLSTHITGMLLEPAKCKENCIAIVRPLGLENKKSWLVPHPNTFSVLVKESSHILVVTMFSAVIVCASFWGPFSKLQDTTTTSQDTYYRSRRLLFFALEQKLKLG